MWSLKPRPDDQKYESEIFYLPHTKMLPLSPTCPFLYTRTSLHNHCPKLEASPIKHCFKDYLDCLYFETPLSSDGDHRVVHLNFRCYFWELVPFVKGGYWTTVPYWCPISTFSFASTATILSEHLFCVIRFLAYHSLSWGLPLFLISLGMNHRFSGI